MVKKAFEETGMTLEKLIDVANARGLRINNLFQLEDAGEPLLITLNKTTRGGLRLLMASLQSSL